jgi:hypothetical protein
MNKKVLAAALCLVLTIPFLGCKEKEKPANVQQMPGQMMPGPMAPGPMPPGAGPVMPPQSPMPPGPMMPGQSVPGGMQKKAPATAMTMPAGEKKVVVPDLVKGKWSAVKLAIEDKTTKQVQEYKVNLHSSFTVPNSNLKLSVGDFLPDFKMGADSLTSGSNDPKNPAVGIQVTEGDKQIFPTPGRKWGWLFAKLPTVHPLKHPRYNIILKEGIKKG